MLSPYRVIDLSDERGQLCGQILGDLGADVILVEPPGGSRARARGPFYRNIANPNQSLHFWAFNRNKRAITLDPDNADDRERLKQLAANADFLVESADPGYFAQRGLGYADLAALNQGLIYVSISAFGQNGPKAGNAAADLTLVAAGGPMMLQGDDDRPPVRIGVPQAYLHASADAAAAALIAHHQRVQSGLGQHIDVSAQEAVSIAAFSQPLVPAIGAAVTKRMSGGVKVGRLIARQVWPARDGYVVLVLWFGPALALPMQRLMQCIFEHGFCDEATRDRDWLTYDARLISGEVPPEEYEALKMIVERFTRSLTKAELLQLALERALLIAPVATVEEVVKSSQLAAREYWRALDHPELGAAMRYPGPFARFSATPITYRRRPPTLGEHNQEILSETYHSATRPVPSPASHSHLTSPATFRLPPRLRSELRPSALGLGSLGQAPRERDRRERARENEQASITSSNQLPLSGLKIVDLFWAMAGPASTRALADYGATVVRVESARRLDTCRTIGPYVSNQPGINRSGIFINLNAGKLGITLDLGKEEGRAVFHDLVRWGDIVTESFSPKAMRAWGLDYQALRQIKPDLIMVSSCLMGQTGPFSKFAGYGNLAAAICGFGNLCGWPDRAPAGPYGSYTDCVAPRFTIASILAALEYRRRTGCGQYIELSQAEASMHFLGPALLDFIANDYVQTPQGNRDRDFAPHGVYPCGGEDSWIAIACTTDERWHALCELIDGSDQPGAGADAPATDARFANLTERLNNQEVLDKVVGNWTRSFEARELESILQSRGIAASKAASSEDMSCDPQLTWRKHFVEVDDQKLGRAVIERFSYILSRTPGRIARSAPALGSDTA
ncbi:MAG: CoA transferase, partial [Deltaproteobacteria bacterium]|nr:CoA transferase [Deltaproteobacteria bacterium]